MKLQSILLSGLFAAIAALPLSANAADADKAAEAKAPAAEAKAKPHSHMTEKTGFEAKAPAADASKADAAKDKKRHLHPRDGK